MENIANVEIYGDILENIQKSRKLLETRSFPYITRVCWQSICPQPFSPPDSEQNSLLELVHSVNKGPKDKHRA